MKNLEEVKKYCKEKGIEVQSGDDYITAGKEGLSEGKKISVTFTVFLSGENEKTLDAECIGLGKDLWEVSPKEAIDAYCTRISVFAHELN